MSHTIFQESKSNEMRVPDPQRELEALLKTAGVAPLTSAGWIKVTGPDRLRWLNGMVTNSVQDLATGNGCYNLLLNAQGRIQGDGYVFAESNHLLFETGRSQLAALTTLLDRFIIMDDVELEDVTFASAGLLLAGPDARAILRSLNLEAPAVHTQTLTRLDWRSKQVVLIGAYSPLVPRFEIWSEAALIAEVAAVLADMSVTECSPDALELLRIIEGTPLFGVDIRDRDLPQETGAVRALHFSKGCYLGQEIVERIHSRGSVHRTFQGFSLEGVAALPGAVLRFDDRSVGELTSIANFPTVSGAEHLQSISQFALGYIRREALAQSKPIRYAGGTAHPTSLPFYPAKILEALHASGPTPNI